MADIDAVLQSSARLFYDEIALDHERAHIDDAIGLIRLDPSIDDEVKFSFDLGLPTPGFLYYDGWIWIVYRMLNNWTISILNIGFEEEIPEPAGTRTAWRDVFVGSTAYRLRSARTKGASRWQRSTARP